MNVVFLAILLMAFMAVFAVLMLRKGGETMRRCPLVKAGDVSKATPAVIPVRNLGNREFEYDGKRVDMSAYDLYVVSGESMACHGIHSGDGVLSFRADFSPVPGDVVIFRIDPSLSQALGRGICSPDAGYKLREYVRTISVADGLDNIIGDVDESCRSEVMRKFEIVSGHYPGNSELIMSKTYRDGVASWSFHSPLLLVGKVDYIVPKSVIEP